MQAGGADRIFEIFSTKEKSEHLVASKVRWDERQRQRVAQTQDKRSQRSVQDVTEASEGIARRMLQYLEDSEVAKVSIRELEGQVLSPKRGERQYGPHCEAGKK